MANVRQFGNHAMNKKPALLTLASMQLVVILLTMTVSPAMQAQTLTVLHSFTDTAFDGGYPNAGVTIRGNALYGTTQEGGLSCGNGRRCGTVLSGDSYRIRLDYHSYLSLSKFGIRRNLPHCPGRFRPGRPHVRNNKLRRRFQ